CALWPRAAARAAVVHVQRVRRVTLWRPRGRPMSRRRARSALVALAAALAMRAMPACAEEEIVLAQLPPGKDAGSLEPKRCVTTLDCAENAFCARADCRDAA